MHIGDVAWRGMLPPGRTGRRVLVGIASPGPVPGRRQPRCRPLRHTYRMDRREDDEDRVAAPEPYWRDIRLIRLVALLGFVVGAVIYVCTVSGSRRTGDTLTIGQVDAEVLDPNPGVFGIIASHDQATDVLGFELSGGGLRTRTGRYWDGVGSGSPPSSEQSGAGCSPAGSRTRDLSRGGDRLAGRRPATLPDGTPSRCRAHPGDPPSTRHDGAIARRMDARGDRTRRRPSRNQWRKHEGDLLPE